MKHSDKLQRVRGIYLFPNILTTAGLFAAFYAIVAAFKGRYEVAAIAIFVAMIADAFDGRVARMTNTESPFGAEYDSMADMVSFGIGPALVVYSWSLQFLGKLGWLAAFMYTATAALRLARFNTSVGTSNKRYFQGLPSPAAAAVLASFVWFCHDNGIAGGSVNYLVAIATVLAGALMVSSVRYYSFKDIDLRGKVPFLAIVLLVVIFVSISINPPLMLLVVFFIYACSGPVMMLFRLRKKRARRRQHR